MYVYVCDSCKKGEHGMCEGTRPPNDIPEHFDAAPDILIGGTCVCDHSQNYQSPDEVWEAHQK